MRWFARLATVVSFLLILANAAVAAVDQPGRDSIESARDLQQDARLATARGIPLVVMVSLAGCHHCETVRRSHLLPLLKQSPSAPTPMIRQVELSGSETLIDFNGKKMSHADFARRNRVSIAPVVLFFGADGERIADPLVGAMIPDFYGSYLDAALAEAMAKAATQKPRTSP